MFDAHHELSEAGHTQKVQIYRNAEPLRYDSVLELWQHDPAFRTFFVEILKDSPFAAFRWETPPVTSSTVSRAFEFVLLDSPGLEVSADCLPFETHLKNLPMEKEVVEFLNLGKDARLTAPAPRARESVYSHLAVFSRQAPASQIHVLWQTVGQAMWRMLGQRPIWLNTAGGGVAWLHVRLDSEPKYYVFKPYMRNSA